MNALLLLERLRESSLAVFSVRDIARIISKSEAYASLVLFRLKKRGLILEVEKGKYCLKDANELAVASNLVFPSFISFLSALSFYKATTQIPVIIEVACLKTKKEVEFKSYKIKFYKIGKNRMFGYKKIFINDKPVFIAEPEKLILDCLFLKQVYLKEVFYLLKNFEIDKEKLLDYAFRLESKVVLKRLAYLIKLTKRSFYKNLTKKRFSKRYELLNPLLPPRGIKNKELKLILNEDVNAE